MQGLAKPDIDYNNTYFLFGEVKDGKMFNVTECFDTALIMTVSFKYKLV